MADEFDAADNSAMRAVLDDIVQLQQLALSSATDPRAFGGDTLARVALGRRRTIEEELRAKACTSDFDPLVLSAYQECLRQAVAPRRSGLDTGLSEVAEALKGLAVIDLWRLLFSNYLSNVFEWKRSAAGENDTSDDIWKDVVAFRETVAAQMADEIIRLMGEKAARADTTAAINALRELMGGE